MLLSAHSTKTLRFTQGLLLCAISLSTPFAYSQESPTTDDTAPTDPWDPLQQAKTLFQNGNYYYKNGDVESALEYFLQSRLLFASQQNTRNAAICLDQLGRHDEALEMYEKLLLQFELDLELLGQIKARMAQLRLLVGHLHITSNVNGLVEIDNRGRVRLPASSPLHVLAGQRLIRVTQQDHAPFELTINVPVGATVHIDALLKPLHKPTAPPPPSTPPSTPTPPPARGGWFVEALGGIAVGRSLGVDKDSTPICTDSCALTAGPYVGLRGGYELPSGLSIELSSGYLALSSSTTRNVQQSFAGQTVTFHLNDNVLVRGTFVAVGASYRFMLNSSLAIVTRASTGLFSLRIANPVTGTAEKGQESVPAFVFGRDTVAPSQPGFILPEIGLQLLVSRFRFAAQLGLLFFLADGSSFGQREIGVMPNCPDATSNAIGCMPNSAVIAGDRAYGSPLQLFLPQFTVRYAF